MNLSAVIGETGSGKTSLLQFLNSLSRTPIGKIDKQGYDEFIEEQNRKISHVTVYLVDRKIQIINKTEKLVHYNNESIYPLTNYDYNHNISLNIYAIL